MYIPVCVLTPTDGEPVQKKASVDEGPKVLTVAKVKDE